MINRLRLAVKRPGTSTVLHTNTPRFHSDGDFP